MRIDDTKLGPAGFGAIAASAMPTLRFIDATVDEESADAFARFIGSPAAAALVCIELEGYDDSPTLSRTLVSRLAALPSLRGFTVRRSELDSEELSHRLPAVAWPIVLATDWNTVFDEYGDHRPSRWPPTDRGVKLADPWA